MIRKIKDPGIGISSIEKAKRFINQDGTFNINHINRKTSFSRSYSYLIGISWPLFFGWVILGYILINALFAAIYLSIGIAAIKEPSGSYVSDFLNAFFFSAQTITTVGYGAMAPKGLIFGIISSFEALVGLLSFSFVTGLLYGRFSRPKANVRFSSTIILKKHEEKDCLMFRLMSRTTNVMIRPKIEVTLALSQQTEDEKYANTFYRLVLQRDTITYLPTTWTVVHPIDEKSPLCKFDREELCKLSGELLILISYYDRSFTQEVHQAHSYVLKDILIDKNFSPAFYYDKEGHTVLDHTKLSEFE